MFAASNHLRMPEEGLFGVPHVIFKKDGFSQGWTDRPDGRAGGKQRGFPPALRGT